MEINNVGSNIAFKMKISNSVNEKLQIETDRILKVNPYYYTELRNNRSNALKKIESWLFLDSELSLGKNEKGRDCLAITYNSKLGDIKKTIHQKQRNILSKFFALKRDDVIAALNDAKTEYYKMYREKNAFKI